MAEFSDSVADSEGQATSSGFRMEATDGGSLLLPDGFSISDANFESDGSDLVLTSADGGQLTVEGFFSQENPPELVSADGAQISGDMAGQLAGGGQEISAGTDSGGVPAGDGMLASNPSIITGTDGEPIGNVENLSGSVFAVRTDGSRVELKEGDSVFQGDIIESSGDGAIGILLADQTTFSMGESGRIVLDEMVYDPATQEGAVNLSVLQGVFTFVSGQVAKTDPDAMTLDTPVATIGIRGTQVGLNVDPEGKGMNVVLMEEADGFVGEVVIGNDGGIQVLNGAYQSTSIANFSTAPTEIRVMDRSELISSFGNSLKQLPKLHGNQNDFGLQGDGVPGEDEGVEEVEEEEAALDEEVEELEDGELTEEELEEFDTAAGDEEEGEGEGDGEFTESEELELDDTILEVVEIPVDVPLDDVPADDDKTSGGGPVIDYSYLAELANQARARAEAGSSAAQAEIVAEKALKLAELAQGLSDTANTIDGELQVLGRFAVGAEALDAMQEVLQTAIDIADAARDAAQAAADAVAAAEAAVLAASSTEGAAAYGARDAAQAALTEAEIALATAEAAAEDAEDQLLAMTEEGGLIDIAEQAVADSDWVGTDGDDFMDVGDLNTTGQTLEGGAGDDILIGRGGGDFLDGGEDFDIASYADSFEGVIVDLAAGTGLGGDAEGDTLINIEGVTGSSFDDTLIGDENDNLLIGGAGSDTIIGGEGTDTTVIEGDFGDYTIVRADDGSITVTAPEIDDVSGDADTLSGIEIIQFGDETVNVLDATGNEDTAISVDVAGALGDLDEAASIIISGVPDDATLSAGSKNADGTWTLNPDEVAGLTVTPFADSDVDFSLTITEIDADGNRSGLGYIDVDVRGVADAANLDLDTNADGAPSADAGATSVLLDINASLTDTDGSETLSLTIEGTGLPGDAVLTLTDGTQVLAVDGVFTLEDVQPGQLTGMTIESASGFTEDFSLTVTAITTELDGGDTTSVSGIIAVKIGEDNIPDAPRLDLDLTKDGDQVVGISKGDEDTLIELDISAELTDPSETLSITIGGIPDGAVLVLADGTELTPDDGEVELSQDQLAGLSIQPNPDDDSDFKLTVTATSTTSSGDSATTTGEINISVEAVADAPELDVTVTQGDPGGTIPMGISSEPAADDPLIDDSSAHQLIGTDEDDVLFGRERSEFISGGAGDDTITGSGGADVIDGGADNDTIDGGGGQDQMFGGTGDDMISGGMGADQLYGGEGDDSLYGGKGADFLSGGAGDDFISGYGIDGASDSQSDTVLFTGSRDQYMITQNEDGSFTVVDMFAGRDGTDTVIHVENFQFSDGTFDADDLTATNPSTFIIDIDSSLTDVDGSESLSFTITGLPEGAYLTFGTEDPAGTWTFTAEDFDDFEVAGGILGVVVPYDVSADFELVVEATSSEINNDSTASVTQTILIDSDASTPELNVLDATGDEDTAIALNLSATLTDTDGSETLSITINGVPEGAILASGGVALIANGDGSYTLSTDQLTGLTITPPEDSSEDFQLTVTATTDEDSGSTTSTTGVINVSVAGVSDGLTLDLGTGIASGTEDTAIALDISAIANDASETMSITISGVPSGATLSAGTDNGDGTWTLTMGQLTDLTVTPAPDSDIDFTLTVTATATDEADSTTVVGTIDVSVAADADAPTLTVSNASGSEDQAIALDISSALTDIDGSETLSVTISGVPDGATLSAGTDSGDGTWTLSPDQLSGLTVTPPADYSGEFALSVSATSTDGTDTATTTGSLTVTVAGTADAPSLDLDSTTDGDQLVGSVSGTEDSAIALDITAALTDLSETLGITIIINGIPPGATLSAGTLNDDGSYSLTEGELSGLSVTPAPDSDADFTLTVTITSTDGTDTATTSGLITVSVAADADAPTLVMTAASGDEDTAIALDISSTLTDGSETLSVTIAGVPDGATLSSGTDNGDGTWTLGPDQLSGLTITPTADSDADFTLTVTATSTDGTDTATTTGTIDVTVDAVADAPTLATTAATGDEDTAIALDITSALTDTDGSETLSVTIAGVPAGATLSAGTYDAETDTWTLSPDQLSGLTITPAADSDADFTLTVTATSTDGTDTATTTATIDVTVDAVADAPTLTTTAASGDEDTAIALDISSTLTDVDGSESLSITISGVPTGATLSAGTNNGDGTWTLDPAKGDLNTLTMTPPLGFSGAIALAVLATALDGTSTALASGTVEVTVAATVVEDTTADGATLTVGAATGFEDTAISLNISAALTDTDGSETLSVTIAGVPDGAVLSAGTDNGDGSWTLESGDLDGLSITPPEDSNIDFNLTVTTTTTESDGGATTTSAPATITVEVTGVADTPTVFAAIGNEVSYQELINDQEPVAYFRMNEVDNDTVVDSTGNLTATYERGAKSKDDKGGIGQGAGDFDGKNDHIDVEHSSSLELSSGSVTLWFNSDDVDDRQGLFSKDSSGYDDGGHLTGYIDDGEVNIRLQSGEDSFWVDGGLLSDNTWHQITFNWGDGGMELYVDGVLVDTNDYTGGLENNDEPMVIGANAWSSDDGESNHLRDYFDGQIDEFAIMSEPLSATDVSNLYNTGGQAILQNGGEIDGTVTGGGSFELQIAGALGDTDSSESLAIVVSGVPDGASLSAGIDNGNGTWTLMPDDLSGLILNTDNTVVENFELTVTAIASEDDGDTATAITTVSVIVDNTTDSSVSLQGGKGDDVLIGGSGDDTLKGRGGDDELFGGGGDDVLFGSSGADTLDGGAGADTLFGSSGKDVLKGGEGDDYLDGGSGSDVIDGGAGNDFIKGGRGDDIITGGTGDDRMEGGDGSDTFMFDSQSGNDIITDILEQDVLVFEGQEFHMDDLILSENSDGDVVVTFGGVEDTSVTLDGVSLDDLDKNNDGDPSDGYTISDEGNGVTITIDNIG